MTIAGTLLLLVVGGLVGADEPAKDEKKQALEKLQGTWSIVSSEIRGTKMAIDPTNDDRTVIDGDKVTVTRGGAVSSTTTIRIDPSKSPKQIDISSVEPDDKTTVAPGIYKQEGDKLTICIAITGGGARPERFEATEKTMLIVLKRADP